MGVRLVGRDSIRRVLGTLMGLKSGLRFANFVAMGAQKLICCRIWCRRSFTLSPVFQHLSFSCIFEVGNVLIADASPLSTLEGTLLPVVLGKVQARKVILQLIFKSEARSTFWPGFVGNLAI